MFHFAIRDLLWLTLVVGLGIGWWLEHRIADTRLREAVTNVACRWSDEVGHTVRFSVKGIRGTHSFAVGLPDIVAPSRASPPNAN